MKIGILTHSLNPRGGVVHTLELAHALQDAGHDVTVMAPALPDQRFFREVRCATSLVPVRDTPQEVVELVRGRIEAFTQHLTQVLRTTRFDVLHAHDGMGGNALADLQEQGLITGFVRTVHHLDRFSQPQLQHWQMRSVRQASLALCVSRLWCDILRHDHGIAAHEVCNGVDVERFTATARADDAEWARQLGVAAGAAGARQGPVILSIGGVEARKNTLRLLQAFVLLRRMPGFAHAQWVLAGGASLLDHSDYAREFHAQVQAAGLQVGASQPLVITGALPDAAIAVLLRQCDVVAMPSLREGFGLVVLEALCSGTPVVASRIAPFTEYLEDTDVSWADPEDAADIARALAHAWHTRDTDRIAASAGRLAQQFSWPRSAQRHLDLYQGMLRKQANLQETTPCL